VPFVPRYRELADTHVRHLRLPAGSPRLLDVGCGEGEFLSEMQSLGWSVEGIDPSSAAVAAALARGVPARQAALDEGTLAEASVDAITFRLVFEHINEPVSALAECRRALRPGGTLWIATPNLRSEAHRLFGRNWIHLEPPRHAVIYSASGLARLLAGAGFDVLDLRPLRQARWSFRLSEALARGLAPFGGPPPLSPQLAFRAARADLKALRSAEAADIIVMIARAC
jgi:2-polyprenyl-3-methyl-5-hydroxy-6-metoxy-1,4-benzoquinol methylase